MRKRPHAPLDLSTLKVPDAGMAEVRPSDYRPFADRELVPGLCEHRRKLGLLYGQAIWEKGEPCASCLLGEAAWLLRELAGGIEDAEIRRTRQAQALALIARLPP